MKEKGKNNEYYRGKYGIDCSDCSDWVDLFRYRVKNTE
jgi:hypothetical protein